MGLMCGTTQSTSIAGGGEKSCFCRPHHQMAGKIILLNTNFVNNQYINIQQQQSWRYVATNAITPTPHTQNNT